MVLLVQLARQERQVTRALSVLRGQLALLVPRVRLDQ